MFDRRVKIFLLLIVLVTGVLLLRSAQVQVLDHKTWNEEAERIMSTGELIETSRGRLLDFKGNVLAEDAPCIDACVDYRAIVDPPEAKWLTSTAIARLRLRLGGDYGSLSKAQRDVKIPEEKQAVIADIHAMFQKLGELGHLSPDDMDQLRASIVRKVDMRRRTVWYSKYEKQLKKQNGQPEPWYSAWLDESQRVPDLDAFQMTVGDEMMPHVILPDIKNAVNNELGKNLSRYPGLVLRASVHRFYPYRNLAAHVIGHQSKVLKEDVEKHLELKGEMREYLPNDLIGRSGLEALCESVLRGTRGKIEHYQGEHAREVTTDPVAGGDVRTSIDIELEQDIQHVFEHVQYGYTYDSPRDELNMPGAAVVLDVATNQVRAMVSNPGYDLNELDDKYSVLAADRFQRPLVNRATQFALEPGSTVKPMVGLAAITQGLFGANDTIECTGYLQLNGRTYWTEGRCWVAKSYERQYGREGVKHHPFPFPHETGFLTFADGLERSCNVFFETLGDRLGIDGISYWFDQFGLGRPTGIGIAEVTGLLPNQARIPAYRRRAAGWFAAIGQDQVHATPIQMANVAATIARNGIWMRPTLLVDKSIAPTTQPDRIDLQLSPEALAEARQGMVQVVNGKAGTGTAPKRNDMVVAGKTGTAQAGKLSIPMVDEHGQRVYKDEPELDKNGVITMVKTPVYDYPPLGTHDHPNPDIPWYRGAGEDQAGRSHAWYIGFAPAQNPKIAFAVVVEYGGSGGVNAGYVANKLIDACIEHGYFEKK